VKKNPHQWKCDDDDEEEKKGWHFIRRVKAYDRGWGTQKQQQKIL